MRKFLMLTWRDKQVVFQAIWMLLYVRIGLRLLGYQRLLKTFSWKTHRHQLEIDDLGRIASLINAVSYRMSANCLHRSLVLWWFLRLRGIESNLHFGIPRTVSATFTAHVWVQIGATVINDRPDVVVSFAELITASAITDQQSHKLF